MISENWEKVKNSGLFSEYYFFALALILAFGTIQTTGTALDTEKPVVTVVSCSMYPHYNVGDVILVKGAPFEDIEVDDVVVYDVPKKIDIEVGGQSYKITEQDPVYTEAGSIQLLQVDLDSRAALIDLNGSRAQIVEGQRLERNGQTIEINSVSGMNIPVIHRTIVKNQNYLETMGDNTLGQHEFEKNITPNQIHGKAIFSVPRIGLVKLLTLDILGYSGDRPLELDNTPRCFIRN